MFPSDYYLVRRKVFKLAGGAFHVYDRSGAVVAFSEQKAFKLKEDIRVFADESKSRELLSIQARQIIDFSAAYDVSDSTTGEKIGAFRRRGGMSILRDEWHVLDAADRKYATVIEDSMVLALLRRLLSNLIPQRYDVFAPDEANGDKIANMDQNFNPFVYKLEVDFSMDPAMRLDHRMGIAAAILLAAVEGKQG
ncbi:MAG: hypothetical protein CVT60_03440 [Actinobacteria bacterium HGW-Actinobacteria-10]|jgi:uncharacterized protein YxjI|nr:MAG: hypothetical protein CVT60_03440 [Actinobacteria bacterium HGW-Actinobacteria-10]